jgi:uncharacterized protein (UPF0332 family)
LNKAKRELKETGLHRGLVEGVHDDRMARMHIAKAEHNLSAALFFQKNNYSDWSASAFFYCIYHCLLAIIRKYGYESRNQECTFATVDMLKEQGKIKLDKKFIDTLNINKSKEDNLSTIKIREDFQYGTEIEFSQKDEFAHLTELCKECLAATREIVFENK